MDELEKAIADLRKKIDRWAKQAEDGRIELAALEKAAKLRPPSVPSGRRDPDGDSESGAFGAADGQGEDGRRPGRRPGAISTDWREVLERLYGAGGAHTYVQIHDIAKSTGKLDVKDIASTRDRVRSFVASGYMNGNAEAGFTVTESAADRFGFNKGDSASSGDGDPLDEADKAEGL